ncbi:Outer membrane efflux protein [compost metagenome]
MRIICLVAMLALKPVFGQQVISLQECLDKAIAYELPASADYTLIKRSEYSRSQHWSSLLPTVNFSSGFNSSFGRRLDPITNSFATNNVNAQSMGLSINMPLFSGFNYFIIRNRLDLEYRQSNLQLQQKINERKVRIIQLYVEACKQAIRLNQVAKRMEVYQKIQDIQRLLLESERIAITDTLKSHNSILQERIAMKETNGALMLATIELNYQMGLPLATRHTFLPGSIVEIKDIALLEEYFGVEQAATNLELMEQQMKAEHSRVLPSLALSGVVATGFSSNNKTDNGSVVTYGDQLGRNVYEGVGLMLNIPIFNRREWQRNKYLYSLSLENLADQKEIAELQVQKREAKLEQELLTKKANQLLHQEIAANLKMVFDKSFLLYQEGKLPYRELEESFIEWQENILKTEIIQLEYAEMQLFEKKDSSIISD